MTFDPRIEATAFRIWQYCNGIEWNATVAEIADALDLPMVNVRNLCAKRGWSNRLRAMKPHDGPYRGSRANLDAAVEEITPNGLLRRADYDFTDRA